MSAKTPRGKKSLDLFINDPELIELSEELYRAAGCIKSKDYLDRFTI